MRVVVQVNLMAEQTSTRRLLELIGHIAATLVTAVGIIAICGWCLDSPLLKAVFYRSPINIKTNAAIGLIAAGGSLFLQVSPKAPSFRVRLAQGLAVVVLLTGALTFSEHVFGWNLHIDELLFQEAHGGLATTSPNRMGPPASLSLALSGIALIGLRRVDQNRRQQVDLASVLAMMVCLIALLPMLGYLFGAPQLYGIARITGIAMPTAATLMTLGIGILSCCSEGRIVSLLCAPTAGGILIRRLLLPALVLPPFLGWLRTIGEREGYYDAPFGRSLLILAFMLIFGRLIWSSGSKLDSADRARGRAEEAERQSQKITRIVTENATAALFMIDRDGYCTYMNPAAEVMTGFLFDEFRKSPFHEMIHHHYPDGRPYPRSECPIERALPNRLEVNSREDVFIRKSGEFFPVLCAVSPIYEAGRPVATVIEVMDLTEQKRNESERRQLLESERSARAEAERASRLKDEFLATLSHELRTPLNAILGWAQLLRRDHLPEEDLKQGIDTIERNTRVQTRIIEDLLDMSRIISGKIRLDLQRVDLAKILEEAIVSATPGAEAKQIQIQRDLSNHAGEVSADPNRMQQVVWNLLNNAIKFTPAGGNIQVSLAVKNDQVEVSVADSGQGIKPEFLPYLFERFRQQDPSTTRKHGGLGLGLSIARQLVELHGGSLHAESAGDGQGSKFTIVMPLPAARDDTQQPREIIPPAPAEDDLPHLGGLMILVVDDEPDSRDVVRRHLEESQAQVVVVQSADEAISVLGLQKFDVIVSDIGMPLKDGYQLIRELRGLQKEAGSQTPAVALTAFARPEDRERALLAGYQAHLAKPVQARELAATIRRLAGQAI